MSEPAVTPACMNCRFQRVVVRDLECRRRSPQHMNLKHAQWPVVKATDWCGEYEAETK